MPYSDFCCSHGSLRGSGIITFVPTHKMHLMKHPLLFGAFAIGALSLNAQTRTGYVSGTTVLGERAGSADRAVTDTIAPGEWYNDPNTQLTQWGALCGTAPATFNCGYIIGTNGYGDKVKAQQFLLLDNPTTVVEGLIFWFYAKNGSTGEASAKLWSLNGNGTTSVGPVTGQAPGTVIGSKSFPISQVDTTDANGFTTVLFDSPIFVNEQFVAGFDMSTLGATDSLALLATGTDGTDFPDFSWEQWDDNRWFTLQAAWSVALNVDLCVFVLVDNSSVGINEAGSMNHMRMSFLNGNVSNGTTLLAYEVVEAGRMDLVVHGNNGQIAYQQTFGSQGAGSYQHTISTAGWAAGVYYVTLKNNGKPLTKKLIVE